LVVLLKLHKAELLAILRAGIDSGARSLAGTTCDFGDDDLAQALAEAFGERLAICTIDGGLTPTQAQCVALEQLQAILAAKEILR
jgi:hypothetical protein